MNSQTYALISHAIAGGIIIGSWAIALFFLRFWRRTRDLLFACFALSFLLIGIERIVIMVVSSHDESQAYVYLLRLCAFLLIGIGILNKNRGSKPGGR